MTGYINSFQSLGASDGPGIRFVVFMQGCPLRCGVCHNPDTWQIQVGKTYSAKEVCDMVERYKTYFGKDGGITVSGGEPLMQPEFVKELFFECKKRNINTCLDTSGIVLNDKVKKMLEYCDLVLLDIKYTDEENYNKYVGCSLSLPLGFLDYLDLIDKPVWLRQVIVPTLHDNKENLSKLCEISKSHKNVVKTELLPFRKICKSKYDSMNMEFAFDKYDAPSMVYIDELYKKYFT